MVCLCFTIRLFVYWYHDYIARALRWPWYLYRLSSVTDRKGTAMRNMRLQILRALLTLIAAETKWSLFADETIKRISLNGNVRISINMSLQFVLKGPINNIPALVRMMAWRCPGNKPLSEPITVYRRIYASLGLNEMNNGNYFDWGCAVLNIGTMIIVSLSKTLCNGEWLSCLYQRPTALGYGYLYFTKDPLHWDMVILSLSKTHCIGI